MNAVNKIKENVDWTQVTSIVVAGTVVGAIVLLARKAGLGQVATLVKGG